MELIDLRWDGEPNQRSSDHAATVALPPTWRAARFGAPGKKSEGGNILEKVCMKQRRDYTELRTIPSLCTRFCSVDRFIPRHAAAP